MCLISDFKGEAMGSPFHGHGVTTWDGVKKKSMGSCTDSMSQGLAATEGTYDAATQEDDRIHGRPRHDRRRSQDAHCFRVARREYARDDGLHDGP